MVVYSLARVFRDVVFYVRTFPGTTSKIHHLPSAYFTFVSTCFVLYLVYLQSGLGRYMNSNLRHELPKQHDYMAPFVSNLLLWPGRNSLVRLGRYSFRLNIRSRKIRPTQNPSSHPNSSYPLLPVEVRCALPEAICP